MTTNTAHAVIYVCIGAQMISPGTSDREVSYAAERIATTTLIAYVSHP